MPAQTYTLPSTPDAASRACDIAEELAEAWSLPPRIADALLLVLGEAVDNAAGHANAYDPERSVTLSFWLDDGSFKTAIEDEGEGLDAGRLAEASLPDDPLAMDGRGLFIIRSLAEEVWLENEGRKLCVAWTLPETE